MDMDAQGSGWLCGQRNEPSTSALSLAFSSAETIRPRVYFHHHPADGLQPAGDPLADVAPATPAGRTVRQACLLHAGAVPALGDVCAPCDFHRRVMLDDGAEQVPIELCISIHGA